MNTQTNPTATTPQYAGFWRRAYASILDGIIVGIVSSPFSMSLFSARIKDGDVSVNYFPGILLGFAYHAFFWIKHNGQTIGKRLMAVKVIRQDGKPIDLTTAITRYIGYILSGTVFCLGFVSIAFDKQKRGWHDRLAKTYVISVGKPKKWLMIILGIFFVLSALFFIAAIGAGFWAARNAGPQLRQELQQLQQQPSDPDDYL